MLVSNHMLIGSAIALIVKQPAIGLPLAAISHLILDTLPHFGYHRRGYSEIFKHRLTYFAVGLDAAAFVVLLVTILSGSWYLLAAAFLAALPDIEWVYRYYYYERTGSVPPPRWWFSKFHEDIQWCERPWGIYVEIILFALVFTYVHSTPGLLG